MTATAPSIAALFDLDGVVFDTEPQYSAFWSKKGKQYHPEIPNFDQKIKGQTLVQIFNTWFKNDQKLQHELAKSLVNFEKDMEMNFIPGIEDFLHELHERGIPTAVVTSSNRDKMRCVYRRHPRFKFLFDEILTSERFTRSKPYPDCYLLGAAVFGLPAAQCVTFEDSFNGLKAARAAGTKVVGLSTTNQAEQIAPLCDIVIPNFNNFNIRNLYTLLG